MRNIGVALFLFCVGAAGCSDAGDGPLAQGKQAEASKLVTCSYDGTLCTTGYICISGPNWQSIELDGPGICVDPSAPPLAPCGGFGGLQCADGFTCIDDPTDNCAPESGGADCAGICVEGTTPLPSQCASTECAYGFACVDDPSDACDPANGGADCGVICVKDTTPAPQQCGGFANIPCSSGLSCVDDPSDDCDPGNGGADCSGICVTP